LISVFAIAPPGSCDDPILAKKEPILQNAFELKSGKTSQGNPNGERPVFQTSFFALCPFQNKINVYNARSVTELPIASVFQSQVLIRREAALRRAPVNTGFGRNKGLGIRPTEDTTDD
jgi:hypothetical protein